MSDPEDQEVCRSTTEDGGDGGKLESGHVGGGVGRCGVVEECRGDRIRESGSDGGRWGDGGGGE